MANGQDPKQRSSVFSQLANRLYPAPTSINMQTGPYELGAYQVDAFGRKYPTPRSTTGEGIWPAPPPYQRPVPHRGHTAQEHENLRQPSRQIGEGEMQGPPAPEMDNPLSALANRLDPQDSQNLTNVKMAYQSPQLENIKEVYNSKTDKFSEKVGDIPEEIGMPYDNWGDTGYATEGMPGAAYKHGDPNAMMSIKPGKKPDWVSMPEGEPINPDLSQYDRPWHETQEARAATSRLDQQARDEGELERMYQSTLPEMNRIQRDANMRIAMNEGKLDPQSLQMRNVSPEGLQAPQPTEVAVPEKMEPGMMYKAREAAPKVAERAAKGIGNTGREIGRFGGNMLNAFLYGADSDKGLFDNVNKTFYGNEKSLGENVFGPKLTPRGEEKGESSDGTVEDFKKRILGDKTSAKGGFKGAFAAARKGGKKTFMYKGKKYTTALKSESKKFPGGYKDIIKQHKTSKKKRNTGGMNPDAKSSRYRYGI